jgi:hypothetical protein
MQGYVQLTDRTKLPLLADDCQRSRSFNDGSAEVVHPLLERCVAQAGSRLQADLFVSAFRLTVCGRSFVPFSRFDRVSATTETAGLTSAGLSAAHSVHVPHLLLDNIFGLFRLCPPKASTLFEYCSVHTQSIVDITFHQFDLHSSPLLDYC